MRDKFVEMTPALYEYMLESGARQDEVLRRIERETAELGAIARMQIAPDEGALLTLLVRAIGARRALEVGTFTGYSAICIARGLADGGALLCCEISERWAEVARGNLADAGVAERVELRVAPALHTLRALPPEPSFDFAFIDADKVGYADYYEETLARLRAGGLIVLDNVLMNGRVLDPADDDEGARAMRELNARIAVDERVDSAMVGVADGLTIVRRR
jgi:caffeoyl-CoA O-methyltransferase